MDKFIGDVIQSRRSIEHFEPNRPLPGETVETLVRLAMHSPSAYNLQNWRFMAVTSTEAKERLMAIAYGQTKVRDASVTFIVCGTLQAHTQLGRLLRPSVETGIMAQQSADAWVRQADAAHAGNPALQRDEAIRSASLAAMTLMLAAEGMGLVSCPMSGFDGVALTREFSLDATDLPVMLVTVGYALPGNAPQKARRPLSDVFAVI